MLTWYPLMRGTDSLGGKSQNTSIIPGLVKQALITGTHAHQ